MKKISSIILVLLLLSISVFASNKQKIFSVEDDEYKTIKSLYILTGHALPSTTGPWSASELEHMLSMVSTGDVPEVMREKYNSLVEELNSSPDIQWKGMGANLNFNFNFIFGVHSNKDSKYSRIDYANALNLLDNENASVNPYEIDKLFSGRKNWSSLYVRNLLPVASFAFETFVNDNVYTFIDLGLYNYFRTDFNSNKPSAFGSNLLFFTDGKFDSGYVDANIPHRGFVAFGDKNWNIQIGRDRISWGAGTVGNLIVSDNMPYQNFLKFSTFSSGFKYSFLSSFFSHPQDYYSSRNGVSYFSHITRNQGTDGISMYLAHRFEARFFHDKFNASINEAIVYESKYNHLDIQILNPMFIWHNLHTNDTANSTLCFELDATPFKGLNIYGQFLIDDYALPGMEGAGSPDSANNPNRFGYLFGTTFKTPFFGGLVSLNAEYTMVDPYTYIRHNPNSTTGESKLYSLDYSLALRQLRPAEGGILWDEYILGYTYGADCKVANLNGEYSNDKLELSLNLLYVAKGTHDNWTESFSTGGQGKDVWKTNSTSCTTVHESDNFRYHELSASEVETLANKGYTYQSAKSRDAVQKTIDCGIAASYQILDNLKVFGQFDYVMIENAFNISGQNDHDSQFVLGAKYSL